MVNMVTINRKDVAIRMVIKHNIIKLVTVVMIEIIVLSANMFSEVNSVSLEIMVTGRISIKFVTS
jgi:hypothetical protein